VITLNHPSDLHHVHGPAWIPLVPAEAALGDAAHPGAVLIRPGTAVVILQDALTAVLVAVVGGTHDAKRGWVPAAWLCQAA